MTYPSSALPLEPEAGAQCTSSAQWDLCEGCQVNGISIATLEPRRLSENRLIYYGRTCQAGFSDPFRKIESLFASNDRKIQLCQLHPRYDRYSRTAS
jgi:hypothetical protein